MNQDDEAIPFTPELLARMAEDMRKRGLVSHAMDDAALFEKRRAGRPAGQGEQLPVAERARKSRAQRAAAGGTRLELTMNAATTSKLAALIAQWQCSTKKEAVELAIARAYATIHRQP
jgi:hypothetical protein